MKRIKIESPEKAVVEEYDDTPPSENEVKLDVEYCGICGSDVHAFLGKHPFIDLPVVPGHEAGARINQLGSNVEDLTAGKKATIIPQLICGECYNCRNGRYNICENLRVIGCQTDGAMAETFNITSDLVIPLSNGFDLKKAPMIEPLAVGVHAVRLAQKIEDESAVVLGAGTIGLLITQLLDVYGASEIIVSDLVQSRLELAQEISNAHTVNPERNNLEKELKTKLEGEAPGLFFEAVGVEQTIRQSIDLVRKGGEIIVVGVFGKDPKVQMGLVQDKEINMKGVLMYLREDFQEAIRLLEENRIEVEPLIDKVYDISEAEKAFRNAETQNRPRPKTLVKITD
ncbi:MAG: zinc-dependent alcohol dehydrogenase [Candidatus Hadarchaeia archaeon]